MVSKNYPPSSSAFTTRFLIDFNAVISFIPPPFVPYETVLPFSVDFFYHIWYSHSNPWQNKPPNILFLRRTFSWCFVVSAVTMLLLEIDFLSSFNLFINCSSERLWLCNPTRNTILTHSQTIWCNFSSCKSYLQATDSSSPTSIRIRLPASSSTLPQSCFSTPEEITCFWLIRVVFPLHFLN